MMVNSPSRARRWTVGLDTPSSRAASRMETKSFLLILLLYHKLLDNVYSLMVQC